MIYKKTEFIDFCLAAFLSIVLSMFLYSFLFGLSHYQNLNDFYVGTTILSNYNKILDLKILFIYLLLFFLILPFCIYGREKIISIFKKVSLNIEFCNGLKEKALKLKSFLLSNVKPFYFPQFVYKYQWLGTLGYLVLYPFNGIVYKKIILVILLFMGVTLFDVHRMRKRGEINKISPWVIASLLLIFFSNTYGQFIVNSDYHHLGEAFSTFFMHDKFNLAYYKDIMMVHGYSDVIHCWFGKYFFNDNTIQGYSMGGVFWGGIKFLITIISASYVFSASKIFITPLLLPVQTNLTNMLLVFLLLLKKDIINKPFLWLLIYIVLSFLFMMYLTTIGSFWILASLPMACYVLIKFIKTIRGGVKFSWIVQLLSIVLLIVLIYVIGHNLLSDYINEAKYYIQGNLFAFGNNFKPLVFSAKYFAIHFIKMFAFIILPFFIIEFIKEYSKEDKNITLLAFLAFCIIFPIISVNYTFGRIDEMRLTRMAIISLPYLSIVVPYFLYKKYKNNLLLTIIFVLIFAYAIYSPLRELPSKYQNNKFIKQETILNNTGKSFVEDKERAEELKNFLNNNSAPEDVFLDITDSGLLYMLSDKKIPVKYVSYYNSITTEQALNSTERLKNNPPKIILIFITNNQFCDNLSASLRILPIVKWILIKNKYKIIYEKYNVYLVRAEESITYTKDELDLMDFVFLLSIHHDLQQLPEVWADSVNTLPMREVELNYKKEIEIKEKESVITVKFDYPLKGEDLDLIYVNPDNLTNNDYMIYENNSETKLICKSEHGSVLIPLDIVPSWILNKDLQTITIRINKKLNSEVKIKFFKRNSSFEI